MASLIDVKSRWTNADPLEVASFAALECYQAQPPKIGKLIDVGKRLFEPGHHTTLEHFYFTFEIEGISVGDVTFGLHLANQFYNSDQRSGRFCVEMFSNPDFERMREFINEFWPDVSGLNAILTYIKMCVDLYNAYIDHATELSAKFIKEERPFASEKYIEQNARKIAQEQLRVFMPVIFPTGLVYTIDLISLVSLYRASFSPVLTSVLDQMVEKVITRFPKLTFMFNRKADAYDLKIKHYVSNQIVYKPSYELIGNLPANAKIVVPAPEDMHPVDVLPFSPKYMDNSVLDIYSRIKISLATMGQDQRHRTISRSLPFFTGDFYLPPIARELNLENIAKNIMGHWTEIKAGIPQSLWRILAPYGAVVEYEKRSNLNALFHEQMKRLCFCAQEEIYHLSRSLRSSIEFTDKNSPILEVLKPPCMRCGKCGEGARYCGRDMKAAERFPIRRV